MRQAGAQAHSRLGEVIGQTSTPTVSHTGHVAEKLLVCFHDGDFCNHLHVGLNDDGDNLANSSEETKRKISCRVFAQAKARREEASMRARVRRRTTDSKSARELTHEVEHDHKDEELPTHKRTDHGLVDSCWHDRFVLCSI
jgi:hypothetical protein